MDTPQKKRETRQEKILKIVDHSGYITTSELADIFDVAIQTIRLDIRGLSDEGKVHKVHGGVKSLDYIEKIKSERLPAKSKINLRRRMAIKVANNVENGSSVFLNGGPLSEAVARALTSHSDLHIVTNNVKAATILGQNTTFQVICAGGQIRSLDCAVINSDTHEFMNRYRLDLAIIETDGIDQDGDLSDYDLSQVRISQIMIRNSGLVMLMSEHKKFGTRAVNRMGNLTEIDMIITDKAPPAKYQSICAQCDVKLIILED